jgi:hypothetical protein
VGCRAVAEKHKLVASKSGITPKAHSTRAAMLFANRPLGAQLSSASKQTSYHGSGSAMPEALQAFYSDD